MTLSLQEAIAEVKRLWAISSPSPDETNFAAIVLNAVASGDLIPKADAEAEVARLREALQMIADGRGKCSECGMIAVGEGAGCVGCDRHYCRWEAQDPQTIARAALGGAG